jgi:hypothetical protein
MISILKLSCVLVALHFLCPGGGPDTAMATDVRPRVDDQIPPMKFDHARLEDAIGMLHDVSGFTLVVKWNVLGAVGVNKDTIINASFRTSRFCNALQFVLDTAAGGRDKLLFEDDGEIITISTPVYFIRPKAYDVRFMFPAGITQAAREEIAAKIVKIVKETVDPQGWGTRGKACVIAAKDGKLSVTQSHDHHVEVEYVLTLFRKYRVSNDPATRPAH